jgi:hypothetical protein
VKLSFFLCRLPLCLRRGVATTDLPLLILLMPSMLLLLLLLLLLLYCSLSSLFLIIPCRCVFVRGRGIWTFSQRTPYAREGLSESSPSY